MTQTADTPSPASIRRAEAAAEVEKTQGWIDFACVILLVIGAMNVIGGIAAIGDSKFFDPDARFFFADLATYGVIVLLAGIIQLLVPMGVRARSFPAIWVGVGVVALNALTHLLMIPAAPYWSLAILALDLLAMYALVVYAEPQTDTGRER